MNNKMPPFGPIQLKHLPIDHLVRWGDHLSVRHPGIDAQHKAIFVMGTRIFEKWRCGGNADQLRRSVDKIALLLKFHFSYEEQLLAEIDFADLAPHIVEHRSIIKDLEFFQSHFPSFANGLARPAKSLLAPSWPAMKTVLGFTIGHVASCDMMFASTLSASQDWLQGTS